MGTAGSRAVNGPRYRFGPLERRGLIAGWRAGQIASVGVGLVAAVLALRADPGPPGVLVAVLVVGLAVALACWPVAGRTGEEWLPVVMRWTAEGLAGHRRCWPGPAEGQCLGPDGVEPVAASSGPVPTRAGQRRVRRPATGQWSGRRSGADPFAGLAVLGVRSDGPAPTAGPAAEGLGLIVDRKAGSYTGVLSLRGHTFSLLGPEEQERRVGGWAAVLASLAREGSAVHRLQWVASAIPDDGRAVRGHLDQRAALDPGAPARRSYLRLLETAGGRTCRHEVLLSVQIATTGRGGRAIRAAGGGEVGAAAVLTRELAALRRQLAEADVTVESELSPAQLATVLRRSGQVDPPSAPAACPPCVVGWPWPMAVEADWARIRTDACWHATYWVAEWPRVDVGPDFLAPLLLGPVRRSLSVVMEPVGPLQATRKAERARTADAADRELRRRGGFLVSARRHREIEQVVQREEELADGHAAVRFSGYVTVTAPTAEQLDDECQATEQAAGQARMELRRLYGDQLRALACTLPLGRGLS